MEGKTILKELDLGNGYSLLRFEDGDVSLVKVITPEGLSDDLEDFMGVPEPAAGKKESEPKEKKVKESKEEKESDKEEEDPGGEDSYTWDDLKEMDFAELEELCEENDLDTDPEDFDEADEDEVLKFRKAIAAEVGIEIPPKSKGKKEEQVEVEKQVEVPADDPYTWDDLKEMDYDELYDLCDEEDLETDPEDFDEDDEDKLRRAIAKEMGIEVPKKKK